MCGPNFRRAGARFVRGPGARAARGPRPRAMARAREAPRRRRSPPYDILSDRRNAPARPYDTRVEPACPHTAAHSRTATPPRPHDAHACHVHL